MVWQIVFWERTWPINIPVYFLFDSKNPLLQFFQDYSTFLLAVLHIHFRSISSTGEIRANVLQKSQQLCHYRISFYYSIVHNSDFNLFSILKDGGTSSRNTYH